jgi:uncharacterized membrane protein YgcG
MQTPPSEPKASTPRRRRWVRPVLVIAVVAVMVVLALVLIPARSDARVLAVSAGSPADATFSLRGPSWVTIHFARYGTVGMTYGMTGPSGMMFDRSMMAGSGGMHGSGGSDAYSFWTWGGDYTCWAEYSTSGSGSMPVWVNMTSAIL